MSAVGPQMNNVELIIFDCDGVLVDSERLTNAVFAEMLVEMGLSITLSDMFDKFVGHSMSKCLQIIEEMLGKPAPEDFADRYRARTRQVLESQLKPVTGVEGAIQKITIPYCVASSGDYEKMRTTLGITGLLPYFDGRLFSVTEVGRGKPYPDVFLYAAQKMEVEPSCCLVIEDTPIGVAAGVAAGMNVFGYAEIMNPARLKEAGASLVFDDMALLPDLVASAAGRSFLP
jgi:HAD superfamily hydrolase (TIGR01509 family)